MYNDGPGPLVAHGLWFSALLRLWEGDGSGALDFGPEVAEIVAPEVARWASSRGRTCKTC
jgi:hypothetical protein